MPAQLSVELWGRSVSDLVLTHNERCNWAAELALELSGKDDSSRRPKATPVVTALNSAASQLLSGLQGGDVGSGETSVYHEVGGGHKGRVI